MLSEQVVCRGRDGGHWRMMRVRSGCACGVTFSIHSSSHFIHLWPRRAQKPLANLLLAVSSQRKYRRAASTNRFRKKCTRIRLQGIKKVGNALTSMLAREKVRKRVQRIKNHQKRGASFLMSLSGWYFSCVSWRYSLKAMSVDDFLGASFMEEDEDEDVSLSGYLRCI